MGVFFTSAANSFLKCHEFALPFAQKILLWLACCAILDTSPIYPVRSDSSLKADRTAHGGAGQTIRGLFGRLGRRDTRDSWDSGTVGKSRVFAILKKNSRSYGTHIDAFCRTLDAQNGAFEILQLIVYSGIKFRYSGNSLPGWTLERAALGCKLQKILASYFEIDIWVEHDPQQFRYVLPANRRMAKALFS